MKLLRYEFKKIFTIKSLILIIIAVVAQIAVTLLPHATEMPYSTEVYKEYISQLKGVYTDEKKAEILSRQDEIEEIILSKDETDLKYKQDLISLEEYEEYNFDYRVALAEENTVNYLAEKCSYFDEIAGETEFFYDTDWSDYFSNSGYNYIIAILIFLLIIPVFDSEYSSGSKMIIATTANGKNKICFCKLFVSALVSFFVSALLYGANYITFLVNTNSTDTYKIKNIMDYSSFGEITLRQYCMTDMLTKALTWVICALLICLISNIVKETAFIFFFSFVLIVMPSFAGGFLTANFWRYILLPFKLNSMYSSDINLIILMIIYLIKATLYSFFAVWVWNIYNTSE